MQTIKSYLYQTIIRVQISDPDIFTVRNPIVYSRPIKVYQGVDNPVQIVMLSQDNKPANLTGYLVQVDIQDSLNRTTINSYTVNFINITKGQGILTLDQATVDSLDQRFYKLTIKRTNIATNTSEAVFIDDNYGIPLDLEVLPAYYNTV